MVDFDDLWRRLAMLAVAMLVLALVPAPGRALASTYRLSPGYLKIMNYYPANHPWDGMWTQYSHADTDADFAKIAALGANTVRVIVHPGVMGYADNQVSARDAADFADVIKTADAHGLWVQLTLFDGPTYWPAGATQASYFDADADAGATRAKSWLTQLLAGYAGDTRIALVELENEVNPQDPKDPNLMRWSKTLLDFLPSLLPGVPRTEDTAGSSTGGPEALMLQSLNASIDVMDAHLYGTPGENAAVLSTLTAWKGSRPVIIGEGGATSGVSSTAAGDQAQARAYSRLRETASMFGISWFAPWTAFDITAAGTPSWLTRPDEAYFGLYRTDGTLKPAATVVTSMFGGTAQPNPFNVDGGFESELTAAPSGSTSLGVWNTHLANQASSIGTVSAQGVGSSTAAYITGSTSSANGLASLYTSFAAPAPGTKVTVSAQVRLSPGSAGSNGLSIAWFNGNSYVSNLTSPNASTTQGGWQTVTLTGVVPAGVNEFDVYVQSANNPATTYFDNVTVTLG